VENEKCSYKRVAVKSLLTFAVCALAALSNAQFSFSESEAIFLNGAPYGFTIKDLNNDSKSEIAVSLENPDKVEIYEPDSFGNYNLLGVPIFLGTNLGPRDIVHGDFDMDGDMDLAVAFSRFDVVRLLINDGSANFSFGTLIPTGLFPTKLSAARIDGDADPDLLAVNRDNSSVSLLLNQSGSFQASVYPVGLDPQDIEMGDFDNDGDLDFATANLLGTGVTVWYNDGEGNFSGRVDLPTISPFVPYDIDCRDIDSDGDDDIVVAGWGGQMNGVNVFRSNGSGFDAPVYYSLRLWAGFGHEALTLGDYDSDGDYDILGGANPNGALDFLVNGGNGSYSAGFEIYAGNPFTEMQSQDLDGDLKPDIIMTHLVSGGGIGAHVDYFFNTSQGNWSQLPPASMELSPGRSMGGTMASLATANNDYLTVAPGITFSTSQAPIQLLVEAVSPLQSPQRMKLGFEGHALAGGIRRTVEAYDFQAAAWETVDVSFLTRGDDMTWFDLPSAARFVQPGIRTVRLRVSLRATAPVFAYPWTAKIDRLAWAIK
jgi:hypothetical protein